MHTVSEASYVFVYIFFIECFDEPYLCYITVISCRVQNYSIQASVSPSSQIENDAIDCLVMTYMQEFNCIGEDIWKLSIIDTFE